MVVGVALLCQMTSKSLNERLEQLRGILNGLRQVNLNGLQTDLKTGSPVSRVDKLS
jgi:hypothetical protein